MMVERVVVATVVAVLIALMFMMMRGQENVLEPGIGAPRHSSNLVDTGRERAQFCWYG